MSGFLKRLVSRTRGKAQVVKPVRADVNTGTYLADTATELEPFESEIDRAIDTADSKPSVTQSVEVSGLAKKHSPARPNGPDVESSRMHKDSRTLVPGSDLSDSEQNLIQSVENPETQAISVAPQNQEEITHSQAAQRFTRPADESLPDRQNSSQLFSDSMPRGPDQPLVATVIGEQSSLVSAARDLSENTVFSARRSNDKRTAGEIDLTQSPAEPGRETTHSRTVEINIGRIEVRANHPPVIDNPNPKKANKTNALSLSDYLQQRKRGER